MFPFKNFSPIRFAWIFFALCASFFMINGGSRAFNGTKSFDFVPVFAGSRCLFNHCNPYDINDLNRSFLEGGGMDSDRADWHKEVPIYPPSTLVIVFPLGLLSFKIARFVWLLVNGGTFLIACALLSQLASRQDRALSIAIAGIVLAGSTALPGLGNPAGLSIGCLFISVWALTQRKYRYLAVTTLGISLAVKPHLALLVALALLFYKECRVQVLQASVGAGSVLAIAVVWLHLSVAPANWFASFAANIKETTSSTGSSYPGPSNPEAMRMVNLQTITSVFNPNARVFEWAAWGVTLLCGTLLLVTFLPLRNSAHSELLALLLAALVTLMPVYHRLYDAKIMLLCMPAVLWIRRTQPLVGNSILVLSLPVMFSLSYQFLNERNLQDIFANVSEWRTVLLGRQAPLCLFLIAILSILAFQKLIGSSGGPSKDVSFRAPGS